MGRSSRGITLLQLLAVVVVVSLIAGVLLPMLAGAMRESKKRDCNNNLRQLGTYLVMYKCKCGGTPYPPAAGHNFWNTLRTVPASQPLVQDDGLFACRVLGTAPSPTHLDYRNANAAAYGAKEMDDGVTMPWMPIGADRPTNHDANGNDDINVLIFGGAVVRARPGDANWKLAITDTYTQ